MNTNESFEIEGEWWLPGADERPVAGRLAFDPEDGCSLFLNRALSTLWDQAETVAPETKLVLTQDLLERSGRYPRIYGRSGLDCFTLDDCFRTRVSMGHGQTIYANRLYRGRHYVEGEGPPEASEISFRAENLTAWAAESVIDQSIEPTRGDTPRWEVVLTRWPERQVVLADGGSFSLTQHSKLSGDQWTARTLSQSYEARVTSLQPVPVDELIAVAGGVQDLVSIATGRTAAFISVHLWHPNCYRERPDGTKFKEPLDIVTRWSARNRETRALDPSDMFLTMEDVGGMEGIARWMNVASQYRDPLIQVMNTKHQAHVFDANQLINYVAAVEALDRGTYQDANLTTRLKRSIEIAGQPFQNFVGRPTKWRKRVVNLRDDAAHSRETLSPGVAGDVHFLAQSCYWLFVTCMLREAGVSDDAVSRLFEHPSIKWLGSRVRVSI